MSEPHKDEYVPKPIDEVRAILADPARECDPGCKGWAVFSGGSNEPDGLHIERCDQCVGELLYDDDVAHLPEAIEALEDARAREAADSDEHQASPRMKARAGWRSDEGGCGTPGCNLCVLRHVVARHATSSYCIDCAQCKKRTWWTEDDSTPVTCDHCHADLVEGLDP